MRSISPESGAIASLTTREHGEISADLFVDCTGFRAQLIGQALKIPFRSCKSVLFCDRAMAMQVPYARPDAPIASYTISTAHEAGWTWDIGLDARRGIGYVYSSAHGTDEQAEHVLRNYIGPLAEGLTPRAFKFEPGYRETTWVKNCVAIGLSSGFFEPLEATGIVMIEVAAIMLSNLFPWAGNVDTAAKQFNKVMLERYERARDFLKLHYFLTKRADGAFWIDNTDPATAPDTLIELLDRWRFRPPEALDFDLNTATFHYGSWQYVLYGMGFKTDLTAKAGAYRYYDQARAQFSTIRQQAERAAQVLPSHRDLVAEVYRSGFKPPAKARAPLRTG